MTVREINFLNDAKEMRSEIVISALKDRAAQGRISEAECYEIGQETGLIAKDIREQFTVVVENRLL